LARCWVLREHAGSDTERVSFSVQSGFGLQTVQAVAWVGVDSGGAAFWWLFENCTVDASIFVVKFLRAHGGCLGIRSR
jgi:hypothetical protein